MDWTIGTRRISGVECQTGRCGGDFPDMRVEARMTPGGNIIYSAWTRKRGYVGEGHQGKPFRSFNGAKAAAEKAMFGSASATPLPGY